MYLTVSVDVDEIELHEVGWHSEEECAEQKGTIATGERASVQDLVAELHRQAHPESTLAFTRCQEFVCRDLTDLLGGDESNV